MKNTLRFVAASAVLVLAGALPSHAQKVQVIGAPASASWGNEVAAKLTATGLFSQVDFFNAALATPTLAQMQGYSSVLVFSDNGFFDNALLGDRLADYYDGGGGVVTSVFANASVPIGGRFNSDNYWALMPANQDQGTELTLGVYDASDPIMAGVASFDGGTSTYRSTGSLAPGATVVASYSNGAPLVVKRIINGRERIDLNLYPPSSDSRSDFWVSSTDGARLMANSLLVAGGDVTATPEPASMILLATGLVGVFAAVRRKPRVG